MKRLVAIVGLALVVSATSAAQAKLKVFACFQEWASLTQAIGGDRVDVTVAVSALDHPETVDPTPSLMASLGIADLVVCTGADMEDGWLPAMLDRVNNPKVVAGEPGHFLAASYVELLEEEGGDGKDDHHLHGEGNPHIQGDPRNMLRVGAQLTRRLIALEPEGEPVYAERFKAFAADLKALTAELEAKGAPLKGERIAVQHGHSAYVLNWLGIVTAATIEPEPGVPPGPQHLIGVIQAVPSNQIKFVIHAGYEDPRPSKYVAERAGIPVVKLPFTVGGSEGATDIFSFYRDTVERLLDGLNGNARP